MTLPEGEQDKTLPTKLQAELPGILTWAVQGCLAWQREGLPLPDAVSRATATYREEMDTLGRFITECCMLVPTRFTTTEALYQAYLTWCNQNGEYQLSKAHFGMRLRNRGLTARREGNERGWEGIVLTSGPDFQDALIEQLKHSQDQQDTPAHGEHPRP